MPALFSSGDEISILIVKLSAIGDVAHTIPALSALRQMFPRARIGWLIEELSSPLLANNPDLNDVFVVRRRWRTKKFLSSWSSEIRPFAKSVRAVKWDVALDLQGLTKSSVYAWFSRAKYRIGFGDHAGRELSRWLNNRFVKPDVVNDRHIAQRNLGLLRSLHPDVPMNATGTIHVTESERASIRALLAAAGVTEGDSLLCVNPAGGWSSKLWPAEHYAEAAARMAQKHSMRPVVLWGPREEPLRDAVLAGLRERGVEGIAAPPTTIRQMCALVAECRFYLGGDTGPSHIAGLLGIPNVSVFGASDGHRNRPWPMHTGLVVQRDDIECVPCWERRCPLAADENLKCLRRLEPVRVIEAAESLITGRRA